MPQLQPELTLRVLSYGLVVFLGMTLLALSLISIRKENRQGQPIKGMIWFTLTIFCLSVFVFFADHLEKVRTLEIISRRVQAMIIGS